MINIKKYLKSIPKSVYNFNFVLIASILSAIIGFGINSILARQMAEEQFGLYRLLIDTVNIIYPLLFFGFQYTWMRTIAI